ncbi:MAG: VanW family protein [Myxococcales bacterium]|nr:VanW family protein [Myxococcales bacterium]
MTRLALLTLALLCVSSTASATTEPSPRAPEAGEVRDELGAVVASASTRFRTRGRHRDRAVNVELAAKLLDGATLAPHEVLSFNERVGERSAARGFRLAPELANGELRRGLGGGVCQVSSTLHVAALRAGLEIVEHRTHSVPAPYVDPGLDATVSWGRIDYRVRNPHDFPVRVRADSTGGVLRVRIEGATELRYEVHTEMVRELPPPALDEAGDPSTQGRPGLVIRVVRVSPEGRREVMLRRYAPRAA